MKVPVSWLNEYVDVEDLSSKELADALTFSGIEVEGIEEVGALLDDHFVVGEVVECGKHTNADHLSVCKVTDGKDIFQVVCGAPNVRVGLKVALARLGAVVPEGGWVIKKAKLRGVESHGMLCSERELKISDEHEGIMELDGSLAPGTFLREALPAPECVLDLEITWNRPDCLSMIGVARELAALLKRPLRIPEVALAESDKEVADLARVVVEDSAGCPRYTARVLENLQHRESPPWMRRRLELAGMRGVSLAVDVTNYVMLECGQPLHAFDCECLAERTIVVRRARDGEAVTTLDGVARTLNTETLVIADARESVAIAGVMGGAESEMTTGSKVTLLESALFDAALTARTSARLGVSSEASRRFERGVDPDLAEWASRRAAALLAEHGGARVARGVIDVDNRGFQPVRVSLRFQRAREIIGLDVPSDEMVEMLTRLELKLVARDRESATFEIPSFRLDLEVEADLIEEVARMHGLDAIPDKVPESASVSLLPQHEFNARQVLRHKLLGMGFSEAMHYSFLSARELDSFDKRQATRRVVLPNPVSDEYGVLRDTLLPQLAGALGRNKARQVERAALFELGRVFQLDDDGEPREEEHLALGILGPFARGLLDRRRVLSNEEAMQWIMGVVEELVSVTNGGKLEFVAKDHPAMEGGWAAEIRLDNNEIGCMGLLSGKLRHQWRMTDPMPLAEMRVVEALFRYPQGRGTIKAVPQYPAVRRDVAMVVGVGVSHRDVLEVIEKAAPESLTSVALFDMFKSKELGKHRRSLGYTLEFRSSDRTLTDNEVNEGLARVVKALRDQLEVEIRGS